MVKTWELGPHPLNLNKKIRVVITFLVGVSCIEGVTSTTPSKDLDTAYSYLQGDVGK